uniref:Amino acid permease/ SLC12A domain-containing protein n=1 Tax=Oryza brachyantha TaxID=4533 RepID=J3LY19_ORYBR
MAGEVAVDSGEKRLNELGYKQELRREMTLFKTLAISFSTMTLFTGITPLYGSSLRYTGPASLVWGWVVVSFFTWFVGFAMAEICSSFPTTGSLYFWAAHLAGPVWGPLASWCCAWLEAIGLIAGIGTQAYAGSQVLQSIILLCTGTNKGGGYLTPRWLFLLMYIGLTFIWAVLNTFALEVIAFLDLISMWWQVIGGTVIVILLPLVANTTQPASYVFTHFETAPEVTGISSSAYAAILSLLVSQYSLYGYDAAAHLTEETKGADKNGPIAILSSIGIITVFGWAYILALTFSIQVCLAAAAAAGLRLPVRPEQRDGRHVRAGADPVRRVPRPVQQLRGRHRAAVRHLGLLLLRRPLHHHQRRPGGVRAVPGQGDPAVVGVAADPPAAQGARQRGVAVRRRVRAAGPAHPVDQRGVHGDHLHRHHWVGGRLRGAHLRPDGDAGGRLLAGPVLPPPRQPPRLPRRLPLDLLHLLRLPPPDHLPDQRWQLQLRPRRARRLPRPHRPLVGARRPQVVQGPRQEHRRPPRQTRRQQRQGLAFFNQV